MRLNLGPLRLGVAWLACSCGWSVLAAQESPTVRSYEARLATTPPTIDGRLDDQAWTVAGWTTPFVDIRGTGWPEPRLSTRAKILWDQDYLYIGAVLEEPHLWATLTERDAIVYHDNDFEVFLDPDGDGLAYYELEMNALGTEFDLFLERPYNQGGTAKYWLEHGGPADDRVLDGQPE